MTGVIELALPMAIPALAYHFRNITGNAEEQERSRIAGDLYHRYFQQELPVCAVEEIKLSQTLPACVDRNASHAIRAIEKYQKERKSWLGTRVCVDDAKTRVLEELKTWLKSVPSNGRMPSEVISTRLAYCRQFLLQSTFSTKSPSFNNTIAHVCEQIDTIYKRVCECDHNGAYKIQDMVTLGQNLVRSTMPVLFYCVSTNLVLPATFDEKREPDLFALVSKLQRGEDDDEDQSNKARCCQVVCCWPQRQTCCQTCFPTRRGQHSRTPGEDKEVPHIRRILVELVCTEHFRNMGTLLVNNEINEGVVFSSPDMTKENNAGLSGAQGFAYIQAHQSTSKRQPAPNLARLNVGAKRSDSCLKSRRTHYEGSRGLHALSRCLTVCLRNTNYDLSRCFTVSLRNTNYEGARWLNVALSGCSTVAVQSASPQPYSQPSSQYACDGFVETLKDFRKKWGQDTIKENSGVIAPFCRGAHLELRKSYLDLLEQTDRVAFFLSVCKPYYNLASLAGDVAMCRLYSSLNHLMRELENALLQHRQARLVVTAAAKRLLQTYSKQSKITAKEKVWMQRLRYIDELGLNNVHEDLAKKCMEVRAAGSIARRFKLQATAKDGLKEIMTAFKSGDYQARSALAVPEGFVDEIKQVANAVERMPTTEKSSQALVDVELEEVS